MAVTTLLNSGMLDLTWARYVRSVVAGTGLPRYGVLRGLAIESHSKAAGHDAVFAGRLPLLELPTGHMPGPPADMAGQQPTAQTAGGQQAAAQQAAGQPAAQLAGEQQGGQQQQQQQQQQQPPLPGPKRMPTRLLGVASKGMPQGSMGTRPKGMALQPPQQQQIPPTGTATLAPAEVPVETIPNSPGQVSVRSSTSPST